MKLIIDIFEEDYNYVKKQVADGIINPLKMHIANGTPLDDVKAEIEKLNPVDYGSMFSYESHNGAKDMQIDVLQILDNIGKESEVKPNE